MARILLITFLVCLVHCADSGAQVYRPSIRWMQMETPHFRIIYSVGQDSLARATGRILESQYPQTSIMTGGNLKRFPVILNDYNDRSNGYVSPLLFRTEIEVSPIKGKSLSPRTGGWLENVLPHELVHAQHMNVMPAPGLSWALSLFSPDIARGLNTFAHSGFLEGIAVYHESSMLDDGGRGNMSTFLYEFDTSWRNGGDDNRWGLGTTLSPAGASHPASRHYMGGYHYAMWLVETYGNKSIRNIIDFHSRWPFLGFGVANWTATGDSPIKMNRSFKEWYDSTQVVYDVNPAIGERQTETTWRGARMRRPQWVNSETLLFYGSAYNQTAGFYQYHFDSNRLKKVLETSIIEDFVYTYQSKIQKITYSTYAPHPYHENRYVSNIHQYSVGEKSAEMVGDSDRMYAPSSVDGRIDALGYYRESSVWVRLNDTKWDTILTIHPDLIVQVQPRPHSDTYAVIANKNGLQAIWFVTKGNETAIWTSLPDIRFLNGSVLDISWSQDGSRLLYTVDMAGGVQLHEYRVRDDSVSQLLSGRPVMLEPSMSPDNQTIAYVYPLGEEYLVGILPYDSFVLRDVPKHIWKGDASPLVKNNRLGDHLTNQSYTWAAHSYRSGIEWLKPRLVYPYLVNSDGLVETRVGLTMQSTELLRRHSYSLDVSTSNKQVWYDIEYQYSGLYPGIVVSTGREPLQGFLNTGDSLVPTVIDDRNTKISVPFRWLLKQNVETTIVRFRPEMQFRSIKAIDTGSGESLSASRRIQTLRGNLMVGLGLEQALRDVQPRRGFVLFVDGRHDLNTYAVTKGKALNIGADMYLPIMSSKNNGLQMRAQLLTQDGGYFYGSSGLHRSQFLNEPYIGERNLFNLQLRYAIPLVFPDRGSLLIPWYLERSWLVFFSNTVGPFGTHSEFDPFRESRTSYGVEWRFITGFPNFRITIGVGLGYEPTRNKAVVFVQ